MNDLERRIQRLEDIEDIRRLKALYSKYADDKYTDSHERKPEAELEELARRQVAGIQCTV
ncbi:MAG: nuclear transport factor 2 family protein [Microvirga sp.]|nr:nuclear transport factor 2 family protein [Microvirga sp.]